MKRISIFKLVIIAVFGALIGVGIAGGVVYSQVSGGGAQDMALTPRDVIARTVADWNEGGPDQLSAELTRTGYVLEGENRFVSEYVVKPIPKNFNFGKYTRGLQSEMQKVWCDPDLQELRNTGAVSIHRFKGGNGRKLGEFETPSGVCKN